MSRQLPAKMPSRSTHPFKEFKDYENGRVRNLKFDVNALADFEQETGMGFAQLMKQKAIFGAARAMLWAGLKHEDRGLTVERIGELLSLYLKDPAVNHGDHTIDTILMIAIESAVAQGALGRTPEPKPEEPAEDEENADPNTLVGEKVPDKDNEPIH